MIDFEELQGHSHRAVAARLLDDGWNVSGLGQWATVWRSPDGLLAARVSPFEPGYQVFTELCRRLAGHPLLPRCDFDTELSGGGRLTVMEYLFPSEPETAEEARQRWDAGEDEFGDVRAEAERLDTEARASLPFWGGLDLNSNNVMRSRSGEVKLVDLFYMSGEALYAELLRDPAAFAKKLPPGRCEFMTEIAFITQYSTPDEIAALREAAEAATSP